MKRFIAILLSIIFLLNLSACKGAEIEQPTISDSVEKEDLSGPIIYKRNTIELKEILYEYDSEIESIEKPIDFSQFVNEINESRKANFDGKPILDTSKLIHDKISGRYAPITKDEINAYQKLGRKQTSLSKKEAVEDAIALDRILVGCYSPYEYFGGDERFNEAHKNILNKIENCKNVYVDTLDFLNILHEEYFFIKDSHFELHNGSSRHYREYRNENGYYYNLFYLPNVYFNKDNVGFYTFVNNSKWYIDNINGQKELEDNLFVSIDENGKLCYILGELSFEVNTKKDMTLTLTNFKDGFDLNLLLLKTHSLLDNVWENNPYEYSALTTENNVPIVAIRAMDSARNGLFTQEDLATFRENGKYLKDEDVLIIDSRSNGGGRNRHALQFYSNMLGLGHSFNDWSWGLSKTAGLRYDIKNNQYRPLSVNGKWSPDSTIKFLLMDKANGSSGESIIEDGRTIENTITIGTNTLGCSIGGNANVFFLPHSGTVCQIGSNCIFIEKADNIEGIGIMPDIWVPSQIALDRTLALIENYNLSDGKYNSEIDKHKYGKADLYDKTRS